MAEKLSITIALEGGRQIEQQLEGIGQAGKKAFEDISKAAEQAGGFKNLKPEEVTQKLQQMGVTGKEALDKISGAVAQATRMERLVGVVQSVETGFANLGAAASAFGRALGPIGVIAGTIGGALVKTMSDAATAIHKADSEAIKLGISIEKFSQFKQGLEQAGFSANAVASGIEKISSAMEKGRLEAVAKAFETLREGATRGFGGQGTAELALLVAQAQRVGPAADAAKEALKQLGVELTGNTIKSLGDLQVQTGSAEAGLRAFVTQLVGMTDIENRNALALRDLGTAAGTELVQGINNGTISLKDHGASIDALVAKYPTLTQAQSNAANTMEQDWNRLGSSWERLKTQIGGTLLVNVPTNLTSTLETISNLLNPAKWSEWGSAAVQAIVDILAKIGELEVKLAHIIGDMLKAIGGAFTGGGGGGPGAGSIPGNAAGGLIGGRGTGTSDSNLAWVSRGEHIMPARAVAQPGVLALLEALRRTGGNLRGVMNGMGRFALGGVVPRFAAGGLVGGGMGHLGTVDLRTDHGSVRLMAGASAVEQLSRLAVTRRMTSTGRKPGFIG